MEAESDQEQFPESLEEICSSLGLNSLQKLWCGHCFHVTDIQNAIGIVEGGFLFSRNLAVQKGKLCIDAGRPEILTGHTFESGGFVRLNFRPKTAALFYSEGHRGSYDKGTMPIPIAFVFSAERVCRLDGARFFPSNPYNVRQCYKQPQDLLKLNWTEILSDGPTNLGNSAQQNVRQAEIQIPDQLSLEFLERMVVRSEAEKRTLMHYLPRIPISIDVDPRFFHGLWAFVDTVDLFPISGTGVVEVSRGIKLDDPIRVQVKLQNGNSQSEIVCDQFIERSVLQYESIPEEIVFKLPIGLRGSVGVEIVFGDAPHQFQGYRCDHIL